MSSENERRAETLSLTGQLDYVMKNVISRPLRSSSLRVPPAGAVNAAPTRPSCMETLIESDKARQFLTRVREETDGR